jgi:peptidoglycan hydrolase CwlO-like protein
MTVTRKELTNILEQAEEAEKTADRLRGSLDQIMNQLKTEYEIDTIEQSKKECTELEEQVERLDERIEKDFNKIKEEFKL